MLDVVAPLFFLAAALMTASGLAKSLRPKATATALVAARLPGGRPAARLLGIGEIAAGTWCLVAPGRAAAAVLAALFLGFALFVTVLLARRTAVSSCGCFGGMEAPPSRLHVVVDLVAAGSGVAVAAGPHIRGLASSAAHLGLSGAVFVIGLAAAVYLTSAMMELLPTLFSSYRRVAENAE